MNDWLLILSVLVETYFVGVLYLHVRPTRGRRIAIQQRPNRALIVLDMQSEFVDGNGYPRAEMQSLTARIETLQSHFLANGDTVLQTRNTYTSPGLRLLVKLFAKGVGLSNSDITPKLMRQDVPVFDHRRSDAFNNRRLSRYLDEQQIGELVLCGLDSAFNLRLTAISAQERGYRVVILDDACISRTENRWPMLRDKLIKRGVRIERSADVTEAG